MVFRRIDAERVLCALVLGWVVTAAGHAHAAGTIQFADPVFELWEGTPRAFVVVRTGDATGPVSVVLEIDVAQGTAIAGVDFAVGASTGVIELAAGEIFKTIEVRAPRDNLEEGVEHARLTLSSATGAMLGRQNQLRLLVRDAADPTQRYDFATRSGDQYRVGDTLGVVPVRVVSEGEAVTFEVSRWRNDNGTVDVSVGGGTATSGVDFTDPGARVSFAQNGLLQTLTISTLEDAEREGVELVELLLNNPQPTGAVRNLVALALLEDDEPGQAGLFQLRPPSGAAARVDVEEDAGAATFRVLRVGGSSGVATVDYAAVPAVAEFVAVPGTDYVPTTGRLVFADGVTEQSFSITVGDDTEITANGDFRVVLANPSTGAEIDPRASSITVAVLDNDFCTTCFVGAPACFIATAAYGSYLDPHVATLRQFRDRYLLTNAPGRAFVAWYYRVSPALAAKIAASPIARATVRFALTPVVYAIAQPWWTAFALLLLAGLAKLRTDRPTHERKHGGARVGAGV